MSRQDIIIEDTNISRLLNCSFYCRKIKLIAESDNVFEDKEYGKERIRKSRAILEGLMKLYPEEFI